MNCHEQVHRVCLSPKSVGAVIWPIKGYICCVCEVSFQLLYRFCAKMRVVYQVLAIDVPGRRFPISSKTCARHHTPFSEGGTPLNAGNFVFSLRPPPSEPVKRSTHNHAAVSQLLRGQANEFRRSKHTAMVTCTCFEAGR